MDTIRSLLNLFDIANYLPDLTLFSAMTKLILWLLMLVGPALMLILGILYYNKPPAEANYAWGFRIYYGMGSVEAWQFTQKLAGRCWTFLGGGMTVIALVLGIFMLFLNAGQSAVMAIWCVIIELVLIIACGIGINAVVLKHYDKDGNPRNAVEEYTDTESE